mmetsp:Transcript_20522/g.47070  ORF Transcript_20522/g.47070 Transcript_20522/m.47070 type:complete len:537 (+) Transcript_20522:133-1743(+)
MHPRQEQEETTINGAESSTEVLNTKLPHSAADKVGMQTPETTTPVRSVSPSSDGGASSHHGASSAHSSTGGEVAATSSENTEVEASEVSAFQSDASTSAPALHATSQDSAGDRGHGAGKSVTGTKASTEKADGRGASGSTRSRGGDRRRDEVDGSRGRGSRTGDDCEAGVESQGNSTASRLMAMPGFSAGDHAGKDRRIIQVLAANERRKDQLWKTAKRVPQILSEGTELFANTELYGSLALFTNENFSACGMAQDWAKYYVHSRSDVDYVVEVMSNVPPPAVVQRVMSKGNWKMVQETKVVKFSTMQYTLLGNFFSEEESSDKDADPVYLDLTCIEKPLHFKRFKKRQEAFRRAFFDVRKQMEAQYAGLGVLAFDAYIHLLKAFAGKVPGNALTGFQATCIGLFTLRINFFRLRPNQSIGVAFFEGFLRFCVQFYGEAPRLPGGFCFPGANYRNFAIDLSHGTWMPRRELCWRSEMYFQAVEAKLGLNAQAQDCVNIAHSLDPARVCAEATSLLQRAFQGPSMCMDGLGLLPRWG